MRLIDVDELLTDITSEIKDCKDILGIIERQTLIDTSKELVICPVKVNMDTDEIIELIKERGWEPVKHGWWRPHFTEPYENEGEVYWWVCSECEEAENRKSDYCPNCGAKMDG